MIERTAIYRKYEAAGTLDHAEKLADAIFKPGLLYTHYSSLNPRTPDYIFSEFEVNPFVIDAEGSLVAIDGLAHFLTREHALPMLTPPNAAGLRPLFWPQGIAVIGVSATDSTKTGNNIATLLHNLGRTDLHLVNPRGGVARIGEKEHPPQYSI